MRASNFMESIEKFSRKMVGHGVFDATDFIVCTHTPFFRVCLCVGLETSFYLISLELVHLQQPLQCFKFGSPCEKEGVEFHRLN